MSYLTRVGLALDILLNVLFGGDAGETISLRCAEAAQRGSRPACAVCAALARLVQKNHCALQLVPGAEPTSASLRAGILLLLLFYLVCKGASLLLHLVF